MTETQLFDTLREGLWISVLVSTPLLAVGLAVGLLVGLFQALTSIQENTLTFVPKVAAMMVVFWVSMSFMTSTIVSFFTGTIVPMIAGELSMDASGYVTLSRQSGLLAQMDIIANNIANTSTSGFRREGMVFSEYLKAAGEAPSLSIGYGNTRVVDQMQGGLSQTGGSFDFAIQGEGFFLIDTPQGQQLTRSGAFGPGPDGTLVTADGYNVLDAGGSTIFVPPSARNITVAQDGTMSVDGAPLARIGLWQPTDPLSMRHEAGTRFSSSGVQVSEGATLMQGYLEESNVDPLKEVASMIAVQRAYEMGQNFLDREDERSRNVISTLGR